MSDRNRSTMLSLDASVVVEIVMGPKSRKLNGLVRDWRQDRREFVAPALLGYEVTNALFSAQLRGVDSDVIVDAFEAVRALPIRFIYDLDLHRQALTLAQRYKQRASYDAHYLALAMNLGLDRYTADRRFFTSLRDEFS